jgi:hypothetical protein
MAEFIADASRARITDLSTAFQVADITVYKAVRSITWQLEIFACRKNQGGTVYALAEHAIAVTCSFKGVAIAQAITLMCK